MARRLGKIDGKMNEAVCMKNRVTLNGGGKRKAKSSQGKSSGNVLGVFYRLLPMGRKDSSFGVNYPKVLVSMII